MRKVLVLFAPVLLFAVQAALGLPFVKERMSLQAAEDQAIVAAVLVGIFCIYQWGIFWGPFKRFTFFERGKLKLLDRESEKLIQQYKAVGITLRINVMLHDRKLFTLLEPWEDHPDRRRPRFFCRCLNPTWVSDTMRNHKDSGLVFTSRQGVCGEAYSSGEASFADFSDSDGVTFCLNQDQIDKTKDLKFVYSFPIRRIDETTLRTTNDVFGVVNFDSRDERSEGLVVDERQLRDLTERARAFSELCALIF